MKTLKRMMSAALAVLLLVCLMAVPASATDPKYTITIHNANAGHTYEAYQIFTGTLAKVGEAEILSNIVWGADVNSAGQSAMGAAGTKANSLTEANVAAFAKELVDNNYLDNDPIASTNALVDISIAGITHKGYVMDGLDPGYYLVRDKSGSLANANDVHTSYILEVVSSITVTPKGSLPTVTNSVADINDSEQTTVDAWADSADYDIGDAVPFRAVGTLPTNLSEYSACAYEFHVNLGAGLQYVSDSVKVYVDGNLINSGFTVDTSATDGCELGILFDNIKGISGVTYQSVIAVEYEATLINGAALGNAYAASEPPADTNACTVHLEFTNDPYGTTRGKTAGDKVNVFTYQLAIDKVNRNGEPLKGAEFKVEKYNKKTDSWANISTIYKETTGNDATQDTIFLVDGVDDGLYRVTETTTPTGYNSTPAFYVEINATHNISGVDNPQMTGLSSNHADEAGNVIAAPANITLNTVNMNNGRVPVVVMNQAGATLPTTGGMGTTLFYVVGIVLVAGAATVLFAKKRTGRN